MGEQVEKCTARVFMSGRSQAVRLPREFRFDCDTVAIRRVGRHVILSPRYESWEDYWQHATRPSADFVEAALSRSGDELPLEERATIDP
ncbi:MAG: type II toxin-antitoxin system VapB family antitoxin [Gammaproteobacteria bacterium]|nr:type II toxin-antitoxin system VapB family antitoxin [Gammaproteobacteria bacterium]